MTDSNYNKLSVDNGNVRKLGNCNEREKNFRSGGYLSREPSELSETVTIEEGLDFILSHFQGPIWPRNLATAATSTRQHTVEDRDRALLYYKAARLEDCRISIFATYEGKAEMGYQNLGPSHIPDMILIDIDLETFKEDTHQFNTAVKTTLRNIKKHLNGAVPTVIWTGSGVHILQPLDIDQAFEDREEFKK